MSLLGDERDPWYTQGDCWALAIALHELTGMPLVAICCGDHPAEDWKDVIWEHVAVRAADGFLIDIRGRRTDEEVIKDFCKTGFLFEGVDKDELNQEQEFLLAFSTWGKVRADARKVAKLLELTIV